jgi:hypothetical protein
MIQLADSSRLYQQQLKSRRSRQVRDKERSFGKRQAIKRSKRVLMELREDNLSVVSDERIGSVLKRELKAAV